MCNPKYDTDTPMYKKKQLTDIENSCGRQGKNSERSMERESGTQTNREWESSR